MIIPVYNTEKYLDKCLDSVVNQTLTDLEIICVNDCSSDRSLDILNHYAKKDPRLKIIDFKKNQGVSIARNTAINIATGEYIGFVDSDDFIDLDFYQKLYSTAIKNNSDLVIGNIKRVDVNGEKIPQFYFDLSYEKIQNNQLNFNQFFWIGLYRKSLIDKHHLNFIENCIYGEDLLFPIKASVFSKNFKIIDSTFYNYRNNPLSITNQEFSLKIVQSHCTFIHALFSFLNSEIADFNIYKKIADSSLSIGFSLFLKTKYKIEYLQLMKEILSKKENTPFIPHSKYFTLLDNIRNLDLKEFEKNVQLLEQKVIFQSLRKGIQKQNLQKKY